MAIVRRATLDDGLALRPLLARAFRDDPLIAWALPNDERRLAATEEWLAWFIDAYLADGMVDYIDGLAGALWLPAGRRTATPPEGAPSLHDLLSSLTGRDHATRVLSSFATLGPRRPADDHIYLHIIGVEPAAQGQGLGALVMQPLLEASERDDVPVHLESANPRNHAFYERLGFERTGVDHLTETGPSLVSFCREPDGDREIA